MPQNYGITLMQVIGDKNQMSDDVFDFMISCLPFPQKSIRSELAKLFSISIFLHQLCKEKELITLENVLYKVFLLMLKKSKEYPTMFFKSLPKTINFSHYALL